MTYKSIQPKRTGCGRQESPMTQSLHCTRATAAKQLMPRDEVLPHRCRQHYIFGYSYSSWRLLLTEQSNRCWPQPASLGDRQACTSARQGRQTCQQQLRHERCHLQPARPGHYASDHTKQRITKTQPRHPTRTKPPTPMQK